MSYEAINTRKAGIKAEIIDVLNFYKILPLSHVVDRIVKSHTSNRQVETGYTYSTVYRVLCSMIAEGELVQFESIQLHNLDIGAFVDNRKKYVVLKDTNLKDVLEYLGGSK